MESNTAPLLEMRGIKKDFFGNQVLTDINFTLKAGEVLGLAGENGAGKSTLMKILFGMDVIRETGGYGGDVLINGEKVTFNTPFDALEAGIGMVHQEFSLIPGFTATENILLNREPQKKNVISEVFGPRLNTLDYKKMKTKAAEAIDKMGVEIDQNMVISDMPVGHKQFTEIARELSKDQLKLLILDEPTAVLTPSESDQLCKAIHKITESGRAVIFISHKLREVIEITDRVTVLRDGNYIGTVDTKDATQVTLAEMMVGRPVTIERKARPVFEKKEPILVMKDVNANDDRGIQALKNFNLTVHSGEIVGVAGVDGNGQRELAECISGLRKPTSGTITIKGKPVTGVISDPSFMGFIPEDRHKTGLVLDFSVAENLVIKEYMNAPYTKNGILQYKEIKRHADEMISKYNVKTPNCDVKAKTLSGGNQQKVVIAREMDPEPVFDMAAHPTRGLDLGAVTNVHDILLNERNRGAAVLFISAELQEIMAVADRIIVLYSGQIMGDLDGETADQNVIGQMMLGQKAEDIK